MRHVRTSISHQNPDPDMSQVRTARYAGRPCAVCGVEFVVGETQIVPSPTERGPKGGKVWQHADASECVQHNPRPSFFGRSARSNPRAYSESPLQKLMGDVYVSREQLAVLAGLFG